MTSVTGEKFTLAEDIKAPPTPKKKKRNDTNNHHVVPLGLLVLLCTAYITVAGLQHHFRHYLRSGVDAFDVLPAKALIPDDAQTETTGDQSERTEMVCRRRHIFGLEVEGNQSGNQHLKRSQPRQLSRRFKNGSGSRQLRMAKSSQSSQKKEAPRKSNTAEPIIYLFALVFIYLLLKAASDINQHYKSNKGDKRLRRCSLQSYAQIHKQDRRASKVEESSLIRRRHVLGEVRSVSVDRCRYTMSKETERYVTMPGARAYPTADYQHRATSPLASRQGSHQHPPRLSAGDGRFEPRKHRRSSVPITINYQTVCFSSPQPSESVRRGSVISLTDTNLPGTSVPADSKRRVRMINRH